MSYTYGLSARKPYCYVFGRPVYPTYKPTDFGFNLPFADSTYESYRSSDIYKTGNLSTHCVEIRNYKEPLECDFCKEMTTWAFRDPKSGIEFCVKCCEKHGLNL